jgi:hypothetical protein
MAIPKPPRTSPSKTPARTWSNFAPDGTQRGPMTGYSWTSGPVPPQVPATNSFVSPPPGRSSISQPQPTATSRNVPISLHAPTAGNASVDQSGAMSGFNIAHISGGTAGGLSPAGKTPGEELLERHGR